MKSMNVQEAKKFIESTNSREFDLIDVRNLTEYTEGHIPNSRLLPVDQIYEWSSTLVKGKKYLIYCRSGGRSAMACNFLTSYGITAINMEGGILEWMKMNYQVEKRK